MDNTVDSSRPSIFPASEQDGSYPRPQLMRPVWADLSGEWGFRFDDNDEGLAEGWQFNPVFDRRIIVPFPPESPASGIHDTGFHSVVWYHCEIGIDDLKEAGLGSQGERLIIHFGAVDYRCNVWLNGILLGEHEGGHTPFSFDATAALTKDRLTQSLVVRAEDLPGDVAQPRGKQDWERDPHVIWYHRTTGIWQPVWLEAVPRVAVETLSWHPDLVTSTVKVAVTFNRLPRPGTVLKVDLTYKGVTIGDLAISANRTRVEGTISLARQTNGQDYEQLLWSPETPRLVDATVTLSDGAGARVDAVGSYLGLRSVAVEGGHFLLNDRPYYLRSVLNQGYWPESHLASPSADALRAEAQLIKDLGFNATRVHQKIEDPRFLYWTDRLGLLVWTEMPSVFEFSRTAIRRVTAEWTEIITRDISHPSIVTWVPLNESWGVQHIAHDKATQDYSRALFHLTKALDSSRPVVSNDGWEHLDSDIWSIHDYEASGPVLRERYADAESARKLFEGMGPSGRRLRLSDESDRGQPIMLTEFGGIKFQTDSESLDDAWGYSTAQSAAEFQAQFRTILEAVHASTILAGYCYTQLTDTLQEANGLVTPDRTPKLPLDVLRAIITGIDAPLDQKYTLESHDRIADPDPTFAPA